MLLTTEALSFNKFKTAIVRDFLENRIMSGSSITFIKICNKTRGREKKKKMMTKIKLQTDKCLCNLCVFPINLQKK